MPLTELNEHKIEQYEEEIEYRLKKAKICFIVAESVMGLPILLTVVVLLLDLWDTNSLSSYSLTTVISTGVLYAWVPGISLLLISYFREKLSFRHRDCEKKIPYILYIILACPPVRWILITFFIAFVNHFAAEHDANWFAYSLVACAYMTRWYFGLAFFPNFVGYIFIIFAFPFARRKWQIQYANDIQISVEYKEKQKQSAQMQKDNDAASELLSKVGKMFFVKYYHQLRDWSEPDVLDAIEERYTEETKRQRIRKAKEIFSKNLHITALKQLVADNNTVDIQTKEKAQELLKQVQK